MKEVTTMKELLSPAGNIESLYTAVKAGADAIYLGGKSFGARKYASNFTNEELKEAVSYAHLYDVKIYVTVNTIIFEEETTAFLSYIDFLYQIGVDALIMQDIGMISLVRQYYPDFEVHASTQLHNHSKEGISFLKSLGITRVVLDRELSLKEINDLDVDIEKEVFIHGALCNSYSGCCLFSSLNGGRSGNRGECVQSCRLPYKLIKNDITISTPNKYLLSTKELNTTPHFKELMKSDIKSFKIEGRMKSPTYVGFITKIYRHLIDSYYHNEELKLTPDEEDNLKIIYNREFTSGYLFNDTVMNTASSNHQGLPIGYVTSVNPSKIKINLFKELNQEDGLRFKNSNLGMIANKIYDSTGKLIKSANKGIIYLDNKVNLKEKDILCKTSSVKLEREINSLPDKKITLTCEVSAQDSSLVVTFIDNHHHIVTTTINTFPAKNRATAPDEIKEKLSKLGNTPFVMQSISINIPSNIFISMKSLNEARRTLIETLVQKRIDIKREPRRLPILSPISSPKENTFEVSVLARTPSQVEAALSSHADLIYLDSKLYQDYKHLPNVYLRLPRVDSGFNSDVTNVLVPTLGSLSYYQNKNANIISDYYLNVVNNSSIEFLLQNKVKRVTISPEVPYQKLANLRQDKIELIIYGRLELMLTKSCPVKEALNSCPCLSKDKYYLEDINHHRFPVLHEGCLTHIMHYKNINCLESLSLYKNMGIKSYRLELFDEGKDEVIALINQIRN